MVKIPTANRSRDLGTSTLSKLWSLSFQMGTDTWPMWMMEHLGRLVDHSARQLWWASYRDLMPKDLLRAMKSGASMVYLVMLICHQVQQAVLLKMISQQLQAHLLLSRPQIQHHLFHLLQILVLQSQLLEHILCHHLKIN